MPSPSRQFRNGQRAAPCDDSSYRSLSLRSSSLDHEARSIEADISTETPVPMPDWSRMEMVPEVLVSAGAQIPKSRQVPFLDSHNRASVADQLGSARDVQIHDGKLTARLHFSEAASSEFTKVREGHVTDVSVGYEVLKRTFVDKGKTQEVMGRSYTGPVNVVTKWRLREVSLTPIGADAQAKLRGLDPAAFRFQSPEERAFVMNEALRKLLESKGMPTGLSDDDAQRWLVENPEKLADEKKPEEAKRSEPSAVDLGKIAEEAARKAIAEQENLRELFRKESDALCEIAGRDDLKAAARDLGSVEKVREFLKAERAKSTQDLGFGPSVRTTGDGFSRLKSDIGAALNLRAVRNAGARADYVEHNLAAELKSESATRWKHAGLYDMAREIVAASGVDVRDLTREGVAICAMFGPQAAGIRSDVALHTTGSFTSLTLDAVNKSMAVGYTEAPATWRGPMRQGSSVQDFKNKHVIRYGAIPNLPVWNDNSDPENASFADARVTYAVEARSLNIDFSYRLLINDDMDALSRIPQQMGFAAARTVNAVAWSQITSNPTMSDGVSLFSDVSGVRKGDNKTTGSVSDYTAALNTMTNLMMQMTGENTPEGVKSADILGLMPRYIVFPSALRGTLLQLVRSETDPKASISGIPNINNGLIPVVEPLLDANSTTAFYLFADPAQIDTVEISFLQGQETPVVRQYMDEKKLSQSFTILQSFGAKAINHRGIQQHTGA